MSKDLNKGSYDYLKYLCTELDLRRARLEKLSQWVLNKDLHFEKECLREEIKVLEKRIALEER